MTVSDPLTGTAFDGLPQVGAIFSTSNGSPTGHYCSGSVVNSPAGDIVVTAAHCVADTSGYVSDIAFVPGYHDNTDPYGVWEVTSIVVSPQWLNDTDPDDDVAFLTVHQSGSSARIQDVVGGDQLGIDAGYDNLVRVVGYPTSTEEPVTCNNYTSEFTDPSLTSPQLEFDCDNYPSGTSGSPFLMNVDSNTNLGTVVGVIGGFETGGDTPNVSYSIYFDDSVASLLATAEAQS
jgi:V8-like Glu-specific endopeptidase